MHENVGLQVLAQKVSIPMVKAIHTSKARIHTIGLECTNAMRVEICVES